jgi:hypothetical protein
MAHTGQDREGSSPDSTPTLDRPAAVVFVVGVAINAESSSALAQDPRIARAQRGMPPGVGWARPGEGTGGDEHEIDCLRPLDVSSEAEQLSA